MASFQSHRLRHMTAQQGPNLTHLTFLSLITYKLLWVRPIGCGFITQKILYNNKIFQKIVILLSCVEGFVQIIQQSTTGIIKE